MKNYYLNKSENKDKISPVIKLVDGVIYVEIYGKLTPFSEWVENIKGLKNEQAK